MRQADSMTDNDARQVADIYLDAIADWWTDAAPSIALLSHIPMEAKLHRDGTLTFDAAAFNLGAILVGVALTQRDIAHDGTLAGQLAAAREYLDALVPYEVDGA